MPTTPALNVLYPEGRYRIHFTTPMIDANNKTWNFQYMIYSGNQYANDFEFDLNATTAPIEVFGVYSEEIAGNITPWGPYSYPENAPVTITLDGSAYPNKVVGSDIYGMIGWRVTKNSSTTDYLPAQSINVTIDANTIVTALYQLSGPGAVTITVSVSGNGTVTTSAGTNPFTAMPGDPVSVTAHPIAGVSEFVNWTNTSTGAIVSTQPTYNFYAPNMNIGLTAHFQPLTVEKRYITFTVVGNGQVTDGTYAFTPGAAYEFDLNELIHLVAAPMSGNKFVAWSGAISGTTNPYDFNITTNMAITATFEPLSANEVPIIFAISGNGTINYPTGIAQIFTVGQWITLIATPTPPATFVNWKLNGGILSSSSTYQFQITADLANKIITAVFSGGVTPTADHTPIYEFVFGLPRVTDFWSFPIISLYDSVVMERKAT